MIVTLGNFQFLGVRHVSGRLYSFQDSYDFKTIHDEASLWSHTKTLIQEAFEWSTFSFLRQNHFKKQETTTAIKD